MREWDSSAASEVGRAESRRKPGPNRLDRVPADHRSAWVTILGTGLMVFALSLASPVDLRAQPAPPQPQPAPIPAPTPGEPDEPREPKEPGKPGEPDEPKKPIAVRADVSFFSIPDALADAKMSYKPLLVIYPGPAPAAEGEEAPTDPWTSIEKTLLAGQRKALDKYVGVTFVDTSAVAVIERFGGVSKTLIALCDFGGNVVKRWDGELPSRGAFRKAVRQVYNANRELATRYQKVLQAVDKAHYALKTDKPKEATALYIEAEKVALPPDSEPRKAVTELRRAIDERIEKRKKKAKELEDKKDYLSAIDELQRIMQDFPLPDVRDELRKKTAELWEKLRGFGR
ncbi:MAG: hypothetical protein KDC38_04510 [Planctomycetes bacterium]|nr:hypothetical protein [Planctomycetota bacterium]